MEFAADIFSWICIVCGSAFAIIGGIGILRLPDFFTRLHAGGITDTMGATLILVGLLAQAEHWQVAVKLVMILFFLLVTSPTSAHALSNAGLTAGLLPMFCGKPEPSGPDSEKEDEPSKR